MKITNPTEEKISMTFEGIIYKIEAMSSLSDVPARAAEHWKAMVHNFVVLSSDEVVIKKEVKKEIVEEEKEKKEEVKKEEKKVPSKKTK